MPPISRNPVGLYSCLRQRSVSQVTMMRKTKRVPRKTNIGGYADSSTWFIDQPNHRNKVRLLTAFTSLLILQTIIRQLCIPHCCSGFLIKYHPTLHLNLMGLSVLLTLSSMPHHQNVLGPSFSVFSKRGFTRCLVMIGFLGGGAVHMLT